MQGSALPATLSERALQAGASGRVNSAALTDAEGCSAPTTVLDSYSDKEDPSGSGVGY